MDRAISELSFAFSAGRLAPLSGTSDSTASPGLPLKKTITSTDKKQIRREKSKVK
jgi:hypothetical protein